MQQSYRRLIVAFVLLVIGAVWAQRRTTKAPTNRQEATDRMLASNTKIDEQILAGASGTQTLKTSRQATGADPVADSEFAQLYNETTKTNDPLRAYHLASSLYKNEWDTEIISLLVRRGIDVYDFSGTFALLGDLDAQGRLEEVVTPEDFILVLFNTLELNQQNIARIKEVVTTYHTEAKLTDAEAAFYHALLAYAKADIPEFINSVEKLQGTEFNDRYTRMETIKAQVYGFVDPPSYYIDGMIGLELFSQGRYKLAILAGDRVVKQDPNYVLWHQLIAYGSFYLSDRRRSYEELERLKQSDNQHTDLYLFLEWVTLYELEDYPTALISLLQVKDAIYRTDTLRYLLLTYQRIGDINKVGEVMRYLLQQPDIWPYDFFTVFDLFFFEPVRQEQDVVLFATFFDLASQRLNTCYEKGKDDYTYVCLYGKAGLLLANGEEAKAQAYLERLVRLYPSAGLFEKLWDIAYHQGNSKQAKEYFTEALALSAHSVQQTSVLEKLKAIKK